MNFDAIKNQAIQPAIDNVQQFINSLNQVPRDVVVDVFINYHYSNK